MAQHVAVETAVEAQRLVHVKDLEGELKSLERDMLDWHADNIERRKPLNRIKAIISKLRHGEAVLGRQLLDYRRDWRDTANATNATNTTEAAEAPAAPRRGPFHAIRALFQQRDKSPPAAP